MLKHCSECLSNVKLLAFLMLESFKILTCGRQKFTIETVTTCLRPLTDATFDTHCQLCKAFKEKTQN